MKNLVRVIIYMCLSTFLFARCDNEKMEGIPEHPVEITFAGNENVFAQTRSYYPIGQDGNGPLYGTIYIRQIEAKQIDTNGKVTEGQYLGAIIKWHQALEINWKPQEI